MKCFFSCLISEGQFTLCGHFLIADASINHQLPTFSVCNQTSQEPCEFLIEIT
jgi:hypothetical protein